MNTIIFQNTFPSIPNLSLHPICHSLFPLLRELGLHCTLHETRSNTRVSSGDWWVQPTKPVSLSMLIQSSPVGGEAGWRRGSTRTSSVITSVATSANPSGSRLVDEALFKRGKGMTVKVTRRNKDNRSYWRSYRWWSSNSILTRRKWSGRTHVQYLHVSLYFRARLFKPWRSDT